uniref:Uncharacterized protein n=1 Tax=viral metagenome TaxID=1070528 RepID=A0A6C0CML8_9ZZZZ
MTSEVKQQSAQKIQLYWKINRVVNHSTVFLNTVNIAKEDELRNFQQSLMSKAVYDYANATLKSLYTYIKKAPQNLEQKQIKHFITAFMVCHNPESVLEKTAEELQKDTLEATLYEFAKQINETMTYVCTHRTPNQLLEMKIHLLYLAVENYMMYFNEWTKIDSINIVNQFAQDYYGLVNKRNIILYSDDASRDEELRMVDNMIASFRKRIKAMAGEYGLEYLDSFVLPNDVEEDGRVDLDESPTPPTSVTERIETHRRESQEMDFNEAQQTIKDVVKKACIDTILEKMNATPPDYTALVSLFESLVEEMSFIIVNNRDERVKEMKQDFDFELLKQMIHNEAFDHADLLVKIEKTFEYMYKYQSEDLDGELNEIKLKTDDKLESGEIYQFLPELLFLLKEHNDKIRLKLFEFMEHLDKIKTTF